ncbi:MAG: Cna B-type domain-containing protein, partial [Firmicutes bacterium]|nr:Cna B-type domain-containing protein [Bacillota bacterium]
FADSGVSLADLQDPDLATHLYAHAQQKKLKAVVKDADSRGEVSFSDLSLGLYLVAQKGTVSGYYATAPFVVSLPMADPEGSGWLYEVSAAPKVEAKPTRPVTPPPYIPPDTPSTPPETPTTPPETPTTPPETPPTTPPETPTTPPQTPPAAPAYTKLSVKKVWASSGDEKPDSITVALLCDGDIFETAELEKANRWSYTWVNLSTQYRWDIAELDVPEGYTVDYSYGEEQVTITNTYIPPKIEIKEESEEITVKKLWDDGEGEARPSCVTVQLWDGSSLYDSVELSAENNWTYTWKNLPQSGAYRVEEVDIPLDYEACYSIDGTEITITNICLLLIPDEMRPTGGLIQTGQLNWPIPVLAGLGILLFMAGWILVFFKRKSGSEK